MTTDQTPHLEDPAPRPTILPFSQGSAAPPLRKAAIPLLALLLILTGCLCRSLPPATGCAAELAAAASAAIPAATGQLVVVLPEPADPTRCRVYLLERVAGGWSLQAGPFPAMTGRNGFAPPGSKREGDGRAPSGIFPLESAFGYAPAVDTRMPYRQATADDLWVDDVHSPDYNTWVRRGETGAASFETMVLADRRYRYGLVTGYNRNPVVPGAGSAIFIHVWLDEGVSTSGCVALSENDMVSLLRWLDPAQRPLVLMGDPAELPHVPGLTGASVPKGCLP